MNFKTESCAKTFFDPIWPGGTNHPHSYKKCHNFRKANDIDLKCYDFS